MRFPGARTGWSLRICFMRTFTRALSPLFSAGATRTGGVLALGRNARLAAWRWGDLLGLLWCPFSRRRCRNGHCFHTRQRAVEAGSSLPAEPRWVLRTRPRQLDLLLKHAARRL